MENIQNVNPFVYKNYDSKAAIRKRNISFSGNEKTDNAPKYKDPSTGSIVGGFLVGSMANSAIVATQTPFAEHVMEKMRSISGGLNAEEAAQVESALSRTLSDSGLKDKGVEIIKASLDNATDIYKIMENEVNNNFLLKSLPQKIKQFVFRMHVLLFILTNDKNRDHKIIKFHIALTADIKLHFCVKRK